MHLNMTAGEKLNGELIGRNAQTVCEWQGNFLTNNNTFPVSLQGKYQRKGVLRQDECFNCQVRKYIRENASMKGRFNMTTCSFCQWVKEELLLNEVLKPGYQKIVAIGFLNKENAPTSQAAQNFPKDVHCPQNEQLEKTVVIFHDESILLM